MNFNGKTLIIIGSILFIFQLANFISLDIITPAFQRAQVLSAISSIIIILIGLLFESFNPISGKKVDLKGDNNFFYDVMPRARNFSFTIIPSFFLFYL